MARGNGKPRPGIRGEAPLPNSQEAEMSVLGAALLQPESIDRAVEMGLHAEAFYRFGHREIWSAMVDMSVSGQAVDLVTLADALDKRGVLAKVGGPAYLAELADAVGTAANVTHHARIILDLAVQRRLIDVGRAITQANMAGPLDDVGAALEEAERAILEIRTTAGGDGLRRIGAPALREKFTEIDARSQAGTGLTGPPTGLIDLDRIMGGLQPSDLIVLAGRPSMGKTALAMNVAVSAAVPHERDHGRNLPAAGVAFFSLEMSLSQLLERLLAMLARVDLQAIRTGRGIGEEEFSRLASASTVIMNAPLWIDDTAALSVLEIRARSRRLKARLDGQGLPLGLIVVDYLQLMKGRGETREQEISDISRSLKALAKELRVPVVALSQLNRELEKRADKKPTLADLRESGAIEQDADVVIFVYRPGAYDQKADQGKAELLVRKQRQGPTGDVPVLFWREHSRFSSTAEA